MPAEARLELKRAYRRLFNSAHSRSDAIELIRAESNTPEVELLLEFVEGSTRGVLV